MKRMLLSAVTALLLTGAAIAQDKAPAKSCKSACCKQPSKTASLRMKTAKPATTQTTTTAAKPANRK